MRQTLIGMCVLIFVGLLVFSAGCDMPGCPEWVCKKDPYVEANQVIDTAIYQINTGQKNWQDAISEAQSQLTEDAQSTIRTELNNLVQGAIGSTGAETRCDADFIRTRVVQDLYRIKAEITGGKAIPQQPWICKAVPNSIDMGLSPQQRPKVTFYGFDFPLNALPRPQIMHYQGAAGSDVSGALSMTSPYEMVLDLGSMGVPLSSQSTKMAVLWNGSLLSEISVHQPPPPVCVEKPDYIPSQSLMLVPAKVNGGNNDFEGLGPQIQSKVQISNYGTRVDAHLEMGAWESPKRDGTQVAGILDAQIYTPPYGYYVKSIQGSTWDTHNYLDTNQLDDFSSGGGPVLTYKFTGDTNGDDIGKTGMTVVLRQIPLVIKQNQNCV
jgi:hypothetical protein